MSMQTESSTSVTETRPEQDHDHPGVDAGATERPKKRRRTAKPNADKKFECPQSGCGKSYSRLEHLYRHQLNHSPKTIYRCDFPDCNRHFVRQDLCVRHKERHSTHGSQLQKRDAFAQASASHTRLTETSPAKGLDRADTTEPLIDPALSADGAVRSRPHSMSAAGLDTSPLPASVDSRFASPTLPHLRGRVDAVTQRQHTASSTSHSPGAEQKTSSWSSRNGHQTYAGYVTSQGPSYRPNLPYSTHDASSFGLSPTMVTSPYVQHVNDLQPQYHPPFHDPTIDTMLSPSDPFAMSNMQGHGIDFGYATNPGMPMLNGDDLGRSAFTYCNDLDLLFNKDYLLDHTDFSLGNVMNLYNDITHPQDQPLPETPVISTLDRASIVQRQTNLSSMSRAFTTAMASQNVISEQKRQKILKIMQTQFVEKKHDAVKKRKDAVFEGDLDSDEHILSLKMMHQYLGSYWYHQHAQLPILHKPTFYPDQTRTLLLMVVLAIGAATLDKAYGTSVTDSAAELANFLIWHIRWEIMRDIDYRPPAKLWVFQTLLLIEVYEKMYATRALHERAHTHHDSILTLMRRGSSLMGRSLSETPPDHEKNGDGFANTTVTATAQQKMEESWLKWITTEATRRAAFAAFVLDSIHCTMFGHSAKMVVHEMRLPLPCDEALWAAGTPQEAARITSSLHDNGIKQTSFLEGLKRTMNGDRVHTNSFGRTAIMAGLLSISWHMTQRDLQLASIGPRAAHSIGGADKWKMNLLRAFVNWKVDFDIALAEAATTPLLPDRFYDTDGRPILEPLDDENIFESRTVLHHLAHIAAHVDIVDCQVFAGADRFLDRLVTRKDSDLIHDKIQRWATRASARDSVFYAVKFIATVLIPPDEGRSTVDGYASPILPQAYDTNRRYIARDDFLLNRPWVLYISALVAWCYGYALEGPIHPPPRDEDFDTYEKREQDMRDYLSRIGGVVAPDDLEAVPGKNRCLGLLLILKESFSGTRWELTRDAAGLLGNAASKLQGRAAETSRGPTVLPNGTDRI